MAKSTQAGFTGGPRPRLDSSHFRHDRQPPKVVNSQAEELYEVAVLLLACVKTVKKEIGLGKRWPGIDPVIRRAEKATKVRPT
jgi:hypothetical protein